VKKGNLYTLVVLLLATVSNSWGQVDPRLADDLFKQTNYLEAIPQYKKLLKIDPKNEKYVFNLALCYLRTEIDKASAIYYLEKLVKLKKKDKETYYYLAEAYTHRYEYDKSMAALKEYKKKPGEFEDKIGEMMFSYEFAKVLYENAIPVTFENMGDKINSEYPDYYPFVSKDESILVFTSRRKEGKGRKEFDGYYPSDIFMTKFNGFNFSPAKPLTSLNTSYDEQCVSLSADGKHMFIYFDNIEDAGDIYESEQSGSNYDRKKKIKEGVNTKAIETASSLSADGNTLLFASNKSGGKGGLDLFMTRKLPSGEWAESQPINSLNTKGNEDFPYLSEDGNTLYFASNGYPGLGGYDVYKSEWDAEDNRWKSPKNLGYPLNTSYDDKVIQFSDDMKHAYLTAVRPGGFGDRDIYRVTLEEVEKKPALFIFSLQDAISSSALKEGLIIIFDKNDEIIGEYKSNASGKISVILEPGAYSIEIESPGYKLGTETFKVSEFDGDKPMNMKTFSLSK
jgi:hypothetical protein